MSWLVPGLVLLGEMLVQRRVEERTSAWLEGRSGVGLIVGSNDGALVGSAAGMEGGGRWKRRRPRLIQVY